MKEIKKEVRSILRQNGFKKISAVNFGSDSQKVYYLYDGTINFNVGKVFYSFGLDKLCGCTAHICGDGYDCATAAFMILPYLKRHISGEISDEIMYRDWIDC